MNRRGNKAKGILKKKTISRGGIWHGLTNNTRQREGASERRRDNPSPQKKARKEEAPKAVEKKTKSSAIGGLLHQWARLADWAL